MGNTNGANAAGISFGARRGIADSHTPQAAPSAVPSQQMGFSSGSTVTGITFGKTREITQ